MLSDEVRKAIPDVLIDRQWHEIEAQYNAPHRFYHAFSHVEEVLRHWIAVDQASGWLRREETSAALVFHDLVYELAWQPGDSEDMSARIARMVLADAGKGLPVDHPAVDVGYDFLDLDYIERLIKLTGRLGRLQSSDLTVEEALFLDCDQAILAADEETYQAHLDDLEQEYLPTKGVSHFQARRLGYVKKMLERPRIFLSEYFADRYEVAARGNLERERLRRDRGAPNRLQLLRERAALVDETNPVGAASEDVDNKDDSAVKDLLAEFGDV